MNYGLHNLKVILELQIWLMDYVIRNVICYYNLTYGLHNPKVTLKLSNALRNI